MALQIPLEANKLKSVKLVKQSIWVSMHYASCLSGI